MRIEFHNLPLCEPFEYWCYICQICNLCFVPLDKCPYCHGTILKGKVGELDLEKLKMEPKE